ncbi:MAG: hypothetical protein N3C12_11000 [Candidatus Binatia bacterium]|nr:hypothetical protein [Candidatus Binatia bacterium]
MMIYLHETIEIRGDGARPYMAAVLERARYSEENKVSRLVCTWQVIGSTSRWPRVVNLWEIDGWGHWAQSLARQFDPSLQDTHLRPWWSAMVRYRRGGFDRILAPAAFCPTRSDILAREVRGWVTEQQIYVLPPGSLPQFFEEVEFVLRPLFQLRSISLVGAYSVPMRPGEALILWSAPDFASLCHWWEEREAVEGWRAWQQRLSRWKARQRVSWLVPFAGTILSPQREAR